MTIDTVKIRREDLDMEELAIFGGKPVRENKIFYGRQYIDQADVDAVAAVMTSDYLTCGP